MLPEYFVPIGVGINAIGGISYLIDTVHGRVQPNRVTWFLWALAPLVTVAAQLDQGVGMQALLTFSVGFIPALIFIASFFNKHSTWQIHRFDIFCGLLSILGLILWQVTKVGNIAIGLSIIADLFAGIPTIRKSFTHPETESFRAFFLGVIGALLAVLSIQTWTFAAAAFSVYFLLSNALISFLILSKIGKRSVK